MQTQAQPPSESIPSGTGSGSGVAIRAAEKGTDNDRIVVSDDESSGSNSSGSINFYDGSEDDASEDWTDKGTDDEDADAADITDADGRLTGPLRAKSMYEMCLLCPSVLRS